MREAILCMRINFQKWRNDPRVFVVAVGVFAFSYWTAGPLVKLAENENMGVSPWTLPFFFENPLMMTLYGCFVMLLFANAPFADLQMPFVVIRSGKGKWLLGQLLYIGVSSFFFVLFWFLTSLIAIVQKLKWDFDWGELLLGVASGEIATDGIPLGLFPNPVVMNVFYGWSGAVIQLVLLWLIAVFMGSLMLAGNLFSNRSLGLIVNGFMTMLPLVVTTPYYIGLFGRSGLWFSPLCWCSLSSFLWEEKGTIPGIGYAIVVLVMGTLLFSGLSFWLFCKRDLRVDFST